jgi:hypothetical protein
MQYTTKSPSMTSFHGSVIKCTVSDLRSILGEPRYQGNDGTDKVNFDWVMETESGDVFSVYDWKEYRPLGENEVIEWHVGGHSAKVTDQAVNEMADGLNKLLS